MKIYYLKVCVVTFAVVALFLYWIICGLSYLDWFLPMGTLVFLCMWAGGKYILYLSCKLPQSHRITKAGPYDNEPELSEDRGIGTLYISISKHSNVRYEFFCFAYLPIIPLGCYAVKKRWIGNKWFGYAQFKWYGYAKFRICEVLPST